MNQPFDPYNINFNGFKLDPYRVIEIFQITDPAAQQILKKVLRFGLKHKDQSQDMEDIRTSAVRWQEMRAEEIRWKNEPELPFAEGEFEDCPSCMRSHPKGGNCPACFICPICDGGPGNNGVCHCPKETKSFAVH